MLKMCFITAGWACRALFSPRALLNLYARLTVSSDRFCNALAFYDSIRLSFLCCTVGSLAFDKKPIKKIDVSEYRNALKMIPHRYLLSAEYETVCSRKHDREPICIHHGGNLTVTFQTIFCMPCQTCRVSLLWSAVRLAFIFANLIDLQ